MVFCGVTCSLVNRFQLFGATYDLNLQGRSEHVCATVTLCTHVIGALSFGVGLVAGHCGRHSVLCFPNVCKHMPGQHLEISHSPSCS